MSQKTDPYQMDRIARLAFAPVYPYLAQKIKEKFGINEGICLDLGSGPGSLAIAMARITDLDVIALDIQPEMIKIAQKNIVEAGLSHRIRTLNADVGSIPLDDNYADLIISRGSLFFWEDRVTTFGEIYRILKPGGVAYCGGGMGNKQIKAQVSEAFDTNPAIRNDKEMWLKMMRQNINKFTPQNLSNELDKAGIAGTIVEENLGIWIQIIK
jgi:ubiquinone/menaquinone biosynthesis C-methylase UbiE